MKNINLKIYDPPRAARGVADGVVPPHAEAGASFAGDFQIERDQPREDTNDQKEDLLYFSERKRFPTYFSGA
jgi:hypothetical protein